MTENSRCQIVSSNSRSFRVQSVWRSHVAGGFVQAQPIQAAELPRGDGVAMCGMNFEDCVEAGGYAEGEVQDSGRMFSRGGC